MGLLQCRRLDGGGWPKKKGDNCGSRIQNHGVDPSLRPGAVLRAFALPYLIFVVSPTDREKGKVHNVRRREDGPLGKQKTEVHYEQHRNVGHHRSRRVLRHLRHLGMLQVLGTPPSRVRDLSEKGKAGVL